MGNCSIHSCMKMTGLCVLEYESSEHVLLRQQEGKFGVFVNWRIVYSPPTSKNPTIIQK
ncbi:hypothetical protein DPMN_145364 [Dreissena polymorpha]|uniref:Uncharacterized protein n=1 Tax=Dreissena polymorpha TaxID=45954 RepID=A0A9D4F4T5_DREPO|nr:hypothetical protein DPMN_145364 [Dreissena polymorpha]